MFAQQKIRGIQMQVSFQSSKVQSQPSFGMAQLTKKGQIAAKRFVAELPQFADQDVYVRKNMLKKLLSPKNGQVAPQTITDFFTYGDTQFTDKNAQFIKKQILPITGQARIKSFLQQEHTKAANILQENNDKVYSTTTTESGMALIEGIIGLFDKNINNPEVSGKKGAKMLDLIKQYLGTEEHVQRAAVITDRMYSKK